MIFFLSRAQARKKASVLLIGEPVWLIENGVLTEYFVVQQGNPDATIYTGDGADGTWLMRRDVSDYGVVTRSNAVLNCENGTYLARFSADVQATIREVTLPRTFEGLGAATSVSTSKIHLPTSVEVGGAKSAGNGKALSYFDGIGDWARVAYLSDSEAAYWLYNGFVSVDVAGGTGTTAALSYVDKTGKITAYALAPATLNIRPLMIIEPETEFSGDNIFVGL